MIKRLQGTLLVIATLSVSACTLLHGGASQPPSTAWTGTYRREDGAYDLYVEKNSGDVVEASVVASGKSPKVWENVVSFQISRVDGARASRLKRPGHDCYLGLERKPQGIEVIDRCNDDYSGLYRPARR